MNRLDLFSIAEFLLQHSTTLSDWERRFVTGMKRLLEDGKTLTEKQENRLILLGARTLEYA